MPYTPCMKGTSVQIKNMYIKQLCGHKVWDLATAFRDLWETGPWAYTTSWGVLDGLTKWGAYDIRVGDGGGGGGL